MLTFEILPLMVALFAIFALKSWWFFSYLVAIQGAVVLLVCLHVMMRNYKPAQDLSIYLAGYWLWKWLCHRFLDTLINEKNLLLLMLALVAVPCWVATKRWKTLTRTLSKQCGEPLERVQSLYPISSWKTFFASYFWIALGCLAGAIFADLSVVPTGSMEPTILVGDLVLINKFSYGFQDPVFYKPWTRRYSPARGDITVFQDIQKKMQLVKRVVGLPGDTIIYEQDQLMIIPANGAAEVPITYCNLTPEVDFLQQPPKIELLQERLGDQEHCIQLINERRSVEEPRYFKQSDVPKNQWVVPEGHFFVIGDNRHNSEDSRFWGFVPQACITGKAWRVLASWDNQANVFWKKIRFNRFFKKLQ